MGMRLSVAAVLGSLLAGAGASLAASYPMKARVFSTVEACKAASIVAAAECEHAYANAKAEFFEAAPRYPTRKDCEARFGRCMIGDISGARQRVTFIPDMKGFVIDNGSQRRVRPVADEGAADALFNPRRIDRDDSMVSAARTAQAQDRWKQMNAPPAAAAPASAIFDAPDIATPGDAKSYPVPAGMLNDMKQRAKLYATPSTN